MIEDEKGNQNMPSFVVHRWWDKEIQEKLEPNENAKGWIWALWELGPCMDPLPHLQSMGNVGELQPSKRHLVFSDVYVSNLNGFVHIRIRVCRLHYDMFVYCFQKQIRSHFDQRWRSKYLRGFDEVGNLLMVVTTILINEGMPLIFIPTFFFWCFLTRYPWQKCWKAHSNCHISNIFDL